MDAVQGRHPFAQGGLVHQQVGNPLPIQFLGS
jgi:hypothetical protein